MAASVGLVGVLEGLDAAVGANDSLELGRGGMKCVGQERRLVGFVCDPGYRPHLGEGELATKESLSNQGPLT